MLFNSLDFLLFISVVLPIYFVINHRYRWLLLLIASYFFYGYWQVNYLIIIIGSTLVDYFVGIKIHKSRDSQTKKIFLYLSLFSNLAVLFVFKYFNFFVENINNIISNTTSNVNAITYSHLLLPVGISFYTFQSLSYSIDIYNGKIKKPESNLGIFALFVSFFPQLVAGPIERASHLLPQFRHRVDFNFERISSGLSLVLWGLFKKIVIADRLALVVNEIYNSPEEYHGMTFILVTVFFAFQIYCDFSGYSDIAIGLSRIMGFDLMQNFRTPYFSKSIGEFWKRWHISLSTWFRDYLYIPLGGNRTLKWRWYYNLFITFLISGLWHGANWTFVIWGAFHGVLLMIESTVNLSRFSSTIFTITRIFKTFLLVCISWVFFRANNLSDAFYILGQILDVSKFDLHQLSLYVVPTYKNTVFAIDIFLSGILIVFLVFAEYLFTHHFHFSKIKPIYKLTIFTLGIWLIFIIGSYQKTEFIYFQF